MDGYKKNIYITQDLLAFLSEIFHVKTEWSKIQSCKRNPSNLRNYYLSHLSGRHKSPCEDITIASSTSCVGGLIPEVQGILSGSI